jgi:LPS export ABC transporter protein LptC
MTRTVRTLRYVLPLLFVAFIVIIVVSYSSNAIRDRQNEAAPFRSELRADDRARSIFESFEDVQTIGGEVAFKIQATRTVGFTSGWYTLEGVRLSIYRKNGSHYEIAADHAQVNSETKEAEAKGNVRVVSSNGMELATDALRFDGERLANQQPVRFRMGGWSGSAGALDLELEQEILRLKQSVEARYTPLEEGEVPTAFKAAEATVLRAAGEVHFAGGVDVNRPAEHLRADRMMARTVQGGKQRLTALEGNGSVVATLVGGSTGVASQSGKTTISGDRFFCEFDGEGELAAVQVQGGPATARLLGPPQRLVTAANFRLTLEQKKPRELRAEPRVVFVESAVQRRTLTADLATVYFDPASGDPSTVHVTRNVSYSEPALQARSDRASYDLAQRKVVMTSNPGSAPTLQSPTETLRATMIEIWTDEGLKASGNVYAQLHPRNRGTTPAADSVLFSGNEPIYVNSNDAIFRRSSMSGTFSGNVRAWQGENTLFSQQLQIVDSGASLTASGGVRTSVVQDATSGGSGGATLITRSSELVALKDARRIDLNGKVKIDDQTRSLSSEKATIFFDEQQRIDRLVADRGLTFTESQTGRQGSGDKVTYRLLEKTILLEGSPATVRDPKGSIRGKQISFDLARNRMSVISGESLTETTYNP